MHLDFCITVDVRAKSDVVFICQRLFMAASCRTEICLGPVAGQAKRAHQVLSRSLSTQ